MDPLWLNGEEYHSFQRVLLIEPSHFKKYPVSKKCIKFLSDLSKNISNILVFVGEFDELQGIVGQNQILFKYHPTQNHYRGTELPREFLHPIDGYYRSFFSYWKKCVKYRKSLDESPKE